MTPTLPPDPLVLELAAGLEARLEALAAQESYRARLKRTAELLGNQHVLAELRAQEQRLAAGRRELEEAREGLFSPPPPNGAVPVTAAALPLPAPAAPAAPLPVPAPRAPDPPAPSPAPPRAVLPAAPEPASEPAPARVPSPPPLVVGPPVAPTWHPRPPAELEVDRQMVELWLDEHPTVSAAEREVVLLELNAWSCTFRRAARERTKHPGSQDEWRQTLRQLVQFKATYFPLETVVALTERIEADPGIWAERAAAYHAARPAVGALHWLERLSESRRERVRRDVPPLLESITAALNLLIRATEVRTDDVREPKARDLKRRVLEVADGFGYAPRSRFADRSNWVLGTEREELEPRWTELQRQVDVGEQRDRLAQELAVLTRQPDFGTAEEHPLALADACGRLLAAGERPSSPRLVSMVYPHRHALANVKELAPLHRQCLLKEERETAGAGLEPEERVTLTAELRAKIQALLPLTRGRVFLMMGGADDGRGARLRGLLQFKECRWPTLSPGQRDPERVEREIGRRDVDYVGVNRFNTVHLDAYRRLCRRYQKPMIVIPRGLGVVQVIECMYLQEVLRQAPEGTLVAA